MCSKEYTAIQYNRKMKNYRQCNQIHSVRSAMEVPEERPEAPIRACATHARREQDGPAFGESVPACQAGGAETGGEGDRTGLLVRPPVRRPSTEAGLRPRGAARHAEALLRSGLRPPGERETLREPGRGRLRACR